MNAPEKFETERLVIRRLAYTDADAIFHTYASKLESVRFISWKVHQTIVDTKAFLEFAIPNFDNGKDYAYAIISKQTGMLMGSIGMVNEGGRVFIGYIIGAEFEGNGYCTEATNCILRHLSNQKDIFRIWACCAVENVGSAKVLEKVGMLREGTIKDWVVFPNLNNEPRDCHFYYLPELNN